MAVDSKVVVRREANRNAGLNERRASVKQDWICVVQMLAGSGGSKIKSMSFECAGVHRPAVIRAMKAF